MRKNVARKMHRMNKFVYYNHLQETGNGMVISSRADRFVNIIRQQTIN